MKKIIASILCAVPLAASGSPTTIDAPVQKVFIPEGFDDNDNVEAVIYGEFPNTCYRLNQVKSSFNSEAKVFEFSVTARKYTDKICAQVVTPYIKTVELELLQAGEYEVKIAEAPEIQQDFEVKPRTTNAPDDFIYAPVTSASISRSSSEGQIGPNSAKQMLNLKGSYPYTIIGCAIVDDVKINVSEENVVVVQPILEFIDDERCDNRTSQDFDLQYEMPKNVSGVGLLHVRVMNGNSINSMIRFE